MNRPIKPLWLALLGFVLVGLAVGVTLFSLNRSVDFYVAPSELIAGNFPAGNLRLGGVVVPGSVKRDGTKITFRVRDYLGYKEEAQEEAQVSEDKDSVMVYFDGRVPDLFAENEVAVAEGSFNDKGVFIASALMAKHDENYVPPSVENSAPPAAENGAGGY